jgi:hypothetical protein
MPNVYAPWRRVDAGVQAHGELARVIRFFSVHEYEHSGWELRLITSTAVLAGQLCGWHLRPDLVFIISFVNRVTKQLEGS